MTARKAGVNVQKLRHMDPLLADPWSVQLGPDVDAAFVAPLDLLVANPFAFILQKLLIHDKRRGCKKAQDLLYSPDTLELFGRRLGDLHTLWSDHVRPAIPKKTVKTLRETVRELFARVSDIHREAARIQQHRYMNPESLRAACEYGLTEILGPTT